MTFKQHVSENTKTKIKVSVDVLNSRMEGIEERISEREDRMRIINPMRTTEGK